MRTHQRIEVALTLRGPVLTQGGQPPNPGIDAPLARDAFGRAMLPYSLIKGKVRDAFLELGLSKPEFDDWLGHGSGVRTSGDEPDRGRLTFGDLAADTSGTTPEGVIHRVAIDADTGAASRQMLAMTEAPYAHGELVTFRGRIEVVADDTEAESIRAELESALGWVPSYGGLRTVGFGRTVGVEAVKTAAPRTATGAPAAGDVLPVRWRVDRPFCFVGRKHTGNHFDSLETIPGSVLKGAVARLVLDCNGSRATAIDPLVSLSRFATLARHFEVVRFAEARPMAEGATARPVEPPLSLVSAPGGLGLYHDVALEPNPRLIGGFAPAFAPDWKAEGAAIRAAFGWPALPRERRVRTAIDPSRGRAADEQLFSYGLVQPARSVGGTVERFVWEGTIGLEAVPAANRDAVRGELDELLAHGLPNLGKTRARADVDWLDTATPDAVGTAARGDSTRVVTLQTDCLMTDPSVLTRQGLEAAYQAFWHEVSGGSLSLARYFARQEPHGGYLARRADASRYEPYLTTVRGSVFVLETAPGADPSAALAAWSRTGLPVPAWVGTRYARAGRPLWRTCPFLPHVGCGEVRVDLVCHDARPPSES